MKVFFVILALVAGAFMPVQAAINARLKDFLGDPASAAFVSFAVGTLALAGYVLALKKPMPVVAAMHAGPAWIWLGGFLGAFFVAVAILLTLKIGVAAMSAWFIAGQLIASLIMDNYGLLGLAVREVSWQRVLGAVLLLTGALLIKKF